LRKLAPGDRLAGAAVNAREQRVAPVHLATGLAAGLHFAHPADPIAQELQAKIETNGIEKTLAEVTGISPDDELGQMVLAKHREIGQDHIHV
jgi:mannitol-1-phosphate 5-dehydrogenase